MRQTINGADFRRLAISAAASVEIHKQQLNELNVFPVPDGDTGTNMSMTINAAASDLRKAEDPTLEKAAAITASAMLRVREAIPALSCPCCSEVFPESLRVPRLLTAFCGQPLFRRAWMLLTRQS